MQVHLLGQRFIHSQYTSICRRHHRIRSDTSASTDTAALPSGWSYPKQVSMYRQASTSKQSISTFTAASRSVGNRQARQRSQAPCCTALYPNQPHLHTRPYDAETSLNTPARPQLPRIDTQASSVQKAAQCIPTVSALARERCSNHMGLIPRWRPRSAIPDI